MTQRVGRGIALLFHDRSTRRRWVVSSTPRPHFTPGKDPVPILQEAGWAPGPVWTGGKSRPHPDFFKILSACIPISIYNKYIALRLPVKGIFSGQNSPPRGLQCALLSEHLSNKLWKDIHSFQFDPRTVQPVAQSLYRLSYPAHCCKYICINICVS